MMVVTVFRQDFCYAHGRQRSGRRQQRFHSDHVDLRHATGRRDRVRRRGPIRSLVPHVRLRADGQGRTLRPLGHTRLRARLPLGILESGEPLVLRYIVMLSRPDVPPVVSKGLSAHANFDVIFFHKEKHNRWQFNHSKIFSNSLPSDNRNLLLLRIRIAELPTFHSIFGRTMSVS